MNITNRELAWHLLRLGIAGLLLWLDVRFFLFYAFTLFLWVSIRLDRLRALSRTYQVVNDCRFLLVLEKLGVDPAEIERFSDAKLAELTTAQQASVERDMRAVTDRD
jgi:hypothetical protein